MSDKFYYSNKYYDSIYEYRHVHIPKGRKVDKLLSEVEWRKLGIQQSMGWEHYLIHTPEPNVLLFRRKLQPEK